MFGKKAKRMLCACLLAGMMGGLTTGPAFAENDGHFLEILDDDGSVFVFYTDGKGHYFCIIYDPDGTPHYANIDGESNPSPDDPNNGKGSYKPDVEGLLKKVKDAYRVGNNIEDTPLGGIINRHGQGFRPKGNPGDADGWDHGPGSAPDHSGDYKKTPKQMREMLIAENIDARARFNIAGGMGGYGDSGEEAPGIDNHGSSNTNNSDDADYRDGQNDNIGDTYDLGPRPDLINPNPDGPTTAAAP